MMRKQVLKHNQNIFEFIVTISFITCLLSGCTNYSKYHPPEIISIGERRVDTETKYRLYAPDWNPDGNKLVVSTDENFLQIIDLVGNSTQILTNVPITAFNQAWSPLGDKILFTDSGGPNIWVLSLIENNAEPEEITSGVIADWSPGGDKIAVGRISATGEKSEKLVEVSIINLLNNVEQTIYSVVDSFPGILAIEWSPNGKLIAFRISYYPTPEISSVVPKEKLVMIDINQKEILEIQEETSLGGLNWSLDSTKILYLIDTDFEGSVFRIRDTQGACTEIFSNLSLVFSPRLSPNESKLAFEGRDGGIFVIETELALGEGFWEIDDPCPVYDSQ